MQNKHIPFNGSDFRIERVTLRKISQSTIDPTITFTRANSPKLHKATLPSAVGRTLYMNANKISNFVVGYPTDLLWLGENVVCAIGPNKQEVTHATSDPSYTWKSQIALNLARMQDKMRTWSSDRYFDGQYVYQFTGDPQSVSGNFGYRTADTFNLYHAFKTNFEPKIRAGFAYKSGGQWTVTPPATAVSGDGRIQLLGDVEDLTTQNAAVYNTFDGIDAARFINLCFINFAARKLTNQFEYTAIEPLGIPLLMIEHKTFNLGGITRAVQQVTPAPLKYTHALAWLIGLHAESDTLAKVEVLKQCIKMLLTKGCTRTVVEKNDDGTVNTVSKGDLVRSLRNSLASSPLITF
jgi:hypothetical protein